MAESEIRKGFHKSETTIQDFQGFFLAGENSEGRVYSLGENSTREVKKTCEKFGPIPHSPLSLVVDSETETETATKTASFIQ